MGEIFKLFGTIGVDTSDAEKGIDEVTGKAKKSGKGIFGAFTNAAKGIGKIAAGIGVFALINKGMNMIVSSTGRAISRVDTLKQFPQVLQQMGYGAEEAERATNKLVDGIEGLPTTLDGITADTQRMVNVFHDVDKSADSAVALNNAFLASSASTDEASRGLDQYIRMLSTGKVNMQSWNTLQETMPYALQETAEAFGFTGRSAQMDFYEALQDGEITMDEFNDKIIELSDAQGGFAEVAKEATKGIATSWTNVQTAVVNGVANSIKAFDDWFESKGFGGISGILDKIKEAVRTTFSTVNDFIPVALDWFEKLFNKISTSKAFNTLKTVVDNAIESIKDLWNQFNETGVLETAYDLLKQVGEAILEIDFVKVVEDITAFIDKWLPLIAGIGAGIAAFQIITGVITLWTTVTTIATGVATAFGAVLAFITSPIGLIVIAIGLLVAAGVALYRNWETVKEFAINIWESIAEFFVGVFDWIMQIFGKAIDWIDSKTNGGFSKVLNVIMKYMKMVQNNIKAVWDYVKNTFKNVLDFLKALVTGDFEGMKNAIQNQMQNSRNLVKNILNNIKNFFGSILGNTLSTVKSRFNSIRDSMMKPIERARDKIKSIIDRIKGFFTNMKLSIPSIKLPKLPKFSMSGSFSLNPPSVPKLGIDWFADGGILTKATAFGMNGNNLMVGGEAGREAVLPLNKETLGGIGEGIASTMGGNETNEILIEILSVLKEIDADLYNIIVSALSTMDIEWNDRELGRLVRKFA